MSDPVRVRMAGMKNRMKTDVAAGNVPAATHEDAMRITAGMFRGRSLKTTSGPGYRPATSRVREAVFSMLEARGIVWGGVRVLDLFAGSGSLGFEAASRGAPEICLVEKAAAAVECLRRNAEALGMGPDQCRIVAADVARFLRPGTGQAYDIVFVDPPYGENRLAHTLTAVQRGGWLAPGGFLLAEVEASLPAASLVAAGGDGLHLETERTYGQTRILLWQFLQSA